MYFFLWGIILGLGIAMPVGPICLEMVRRNLHYGAAYGVALGLGACTADVTYLVLLCMGALTLLQHAEVLRVISIIGAGMLAWFGITALRATSQKSFRTGVSPSVLKNGVQGYVLTLMNP